MLKISHFRMFVCDLNLNLFFRIVFRCQHVDSKFDSHFEIDNINENTISFLSIALSMHRTKKSDFFQGANEQTKPKTVFIYQYCVPTTEGKNRVFKSLSASEKKISLNAALFNCSNRHHHTICAFVSIFALKSMEKKGEKMRKRRILYSFAKKWTDFKCLVTTFSGFIFYIWTVRKCQNHFANVL